MNAMTAKNYTTIPHFQVQFSHRKYYNVLITVGDEVIHCVKDVHNFYNELGYTDKIRDTGLCFDEYVWLEYKKNNSDKLEICLQAKIIKFLIKYSATFIKKYADQYENWIGSCNELMQSDDDCNQCILHPSQSDNEFFDCSPHSAVTSYVANTI